MAHNFCFCFVDQSPPELSSQLETGSDPNNMVALELLAVPESSTVITGMRAGTDEVTRALNIEA